MVRAIVYLKPILPNSSQNINFNFIYLHKYIVVIYNKCISRAIDRVPNVLSSCILLSMTWIE